MVGSRNACEHRIYYAKLTTRCGGPTNPLCAFTKLDHARDHRGVDLISDVLPFGRRWYDTPDNAIGYAMHNSRSQDAVIRVYDNAGKVIGTHEHKGDFKAW